MSRRTVRTPSLKKRVVVPVLGGLAATALVATSNFAGAAPADSPSGADQSMTTAFTEAAEEYQVPRDLLVAVGYGESRLKDHDGKPSHAGGYGVMHLVSNPGHTTLKEAAKLTGEPAADLRADTGTNIQGAAAVLRDYADTLGLDATERQDVDNWYATVARYGGAKDDTTARLYADTVYELLSDGIKAGAQAGEKITVKPREVSPDRGELAKVEPHGAGTKSEDYPPAAWVPADSSNYTSGRTAAISAVVVHVTQGSYAGTISWFQNPEADVSAHYVIRSEDGDVTQMVRDADTGWHARSGNPYSVGLEHEGFVDDPAWFTDAMYRSSAELTKHLADKHGIPKNRDHIVGHNEVPGNDHSDPGPNWDWDFYMSLVNG